MTTKTNGITAEVKANTDHIDQVKESPALNNVSN